ncbi:MAG: glutamine-hydrolyzing carbamoyl-phosphate synthase small subunit [candidate division KSB1 bacterium]|nr:glutamine-hydrolyzing carbamoyl-phosphate synthase small subunit [candidate division KSB1 bacterium]MDZ7301625.1 glutamine-hydrolyzing carbamoyl-phosphate synthase small subunit [candidate division KSB1 bacterium]MDZ7310959.1 glutamine-hydrolyzing carbamoyl-phosphate synthase small subunit [candidate division KSB1 bacterium]
MINQIKPALLVLSDGTIFRGRSLGAEGEAIGEVVFNTSMSGYQEILTDPSYYGQMVTMTYSHIGNYGINDEDVESQRPFVSGFIVKEACAQPSNWRSSESLDAYLRRHHIVGIQGIDTRALTRHLRDYGAQMGIISTIDLLPQNLLEKVKAVPDLIGRDLVKEVTCQTPYSWNEPLPLDFYHSCAVPMSFSSMQSPKMLVIDCGVKRNILRWAVTLGFEVEVVPANTGSNDILLRHPDVIFFSNGPGDPEGVPYVIRTARELIGRKPIFGICLGHQILGLALGGKTFKLKFGHHGANHPVKNLQNGKVEITSQNHNYAVDPDSLPAGTIECTHTNLNDHTLEGFRHLDAPVFSVQYHPEASPGPHDSGYLFGELQKLVGRLGG